MTEDPEIHSVSQQNSFDKNSWQSITSTSVCSHTLGLCEIMKWKLAFKVVFRLTFGSVKC